jgi:hypothetical protein
VITQTPKTDFLRGKHDKYRMHPTYDGDTVAIAGTTIARIATGTYTGDGATSQAVSGVGFEPKWVRIFERSTSNGAGIWIGETTDTIVDDNAAGGSVTYEATWTAAGQFRTNEIISLDTDGFTVDDDSADAHPNKNSTVYSYIAIG